MTVKAARRGPPVEDSRTRILEAAHALFDEHGSGDVTMAEVAARAEVSRATVFNHFGSKHALIEAVTESVYVGYEAILEKALDDRRTPAPILVRALFEHMGRGIENERRFYRTVFREIGRVALGLEEGGVAQQARQRAVSRLVHLLTRGQARGELHAALNPEVLAIAFDSLVFGTITHWLYDDASEPLAEQMRAAAEVFLGPVATSSADAWSGPEPDLFVPGDSRFGNAPRGEPEPQSSRRRE